MKSWRSAGFLVAAGLVLAASLVSPFAAAPVRAAGVRVAVVMSHDQPPFEEALAGLQEIFQKDGMEPEYRIARLQGVAARSEALQGIRRDGVDVVVAFGSLAVEAAMTTIPDRPVVAGMVMGKIERTANLTGVSLDISPRDQFSWLKRFLPKAATVGVLYNPAENEALVTEAARVAGDMGLRLEKRPVAVPAELMPALDGLDNGIDVLWGVNDGVVLTPQTAKKILLFSFRNRIPFVGLSEAWVKAGALYALDRDYRDIGRQCGGMALRIVRGESPSSIPPEGPRRLTYSINAKTAQQMKLDLPPALVRDAAQAF